MVLQKQIVPIEIGPLNQGADPKKVPVGTLIDNANVEFNKDGRIDKRTGFDALSSAQTPKALFTRGKDLIGHDDGTLYQYETAGGNWVTRYTHVPCRVKTKDVGGNVGSAYGASSVYANGYTASIFSVNGPTETGSSITISVVRESDGTEVVSASPVASAVIQDKIFAQVTNIGTDIIFIYTDGAVIRGCKFNTEAPQSGLTAFSVMASDRSTTDYPMKVINYDADEIVVGYWDGTNTKLNWFNSSLASTATLTTSGRGVHAMATDSNNGILYVVYGEASGNGLRAWVVNTSKATVATAELTTDTGAYGASVHGETDGGGALIIYHTSSNILNDSSADTGVDSHVIYQRRITFGGTLGTAFSIAKDCYIWSDIFEYNSELYFVSLYASSTQPTYYLVRLNETVGIGQDGQRIMAVFLPQEGSDTRPHLSASVARISSTKFKIPLLRAIKVNDASLIEGCALSTVEFTPNAPLPHASLGSRTLLGGGYLGVYDGYSVVELGFFHYPDALWLHKQTAGGAFSANASHNYIAVYEWYDNNGLLHRSEPSVPLAVSTTSGNKNIIRVKNLQVTNRTSDASSLLDGLRRFPPKTILYRTKDGGSTYYRTAEKQQLFGFADYTEFSDDELDSAIEDNEILYSTGGIVVPQCPPACGHVQVWKNRVILTDCEKQNEAYYSKVKENGVEFEFNLNNLIQVDQLGTDDCRASFPLDDKLLFLKDDRLLVIYGDGPNNAGGDALFPEPVEINFPTGIRDQASLARIPGGCIFKTDRGFYAMGADLNPVPIGRAVEDENAATCTSAVQVPGTDQVRFTHSDGSILMYDYLLQQWSYYASHQASSAVIWQDKYTFTTTAGVVYSQNDAVYKDNTSNYNFMMQTGWISLASLSGLQRVYKLFIEAEYKSAHSIDVTIDLEQNGTVYTETHTVVADTVTATGTETYRFQINLGRQKCSSIRVKIQDTLVDGSSGTHQALNLLGLGLEVGLKRGGPKYKLTHKVG